MHGKGVVTKGEPRMLFECVFNHGELQSQVSSSSAFLSSLELSDTKVYEP